jgi:hypothetical protein
VREFELYFTILYLAVPDCTSLRWTIALEKLANLRWYHFEQDWIRQDIPHISVPGELIKGHGRGKFKGIRQEAFLTGEAKRGLVRKKPTPSYGGKASKFTR